MGGETVPLEIKCYHCDKYHNFDLTDKTKGHIEYKECDCGYGIQIFINRHGVVCIEGYEV